MLYLQSEALLTSSREIELEKSLRDWFGRMGISPGGKSIADVREQAERITRCRLTFEVQQAGRSALVQQLIVDNALFTDNEDNGGTLLLERTRLSETFYQQLTRHPVPVEDAAIRGVNRHSMALDLYCWLASAFTPYLALPQYLGARCTHNSEPPSVGSTISAKRSLSSFR